MTGYNYVLCKNTGFVTQHKCVSLLFLACLFSLNIPCFTDAKDKFTFSELFSTLHPNQ